jgi:hypothetical protein
MKTLRNARAALVAPVVLALALPALAADETKPAAAGAAVAAEPATAAAAAGDAAPAGVLVPTADDAVATAAVPAPGATADLPADASQSPSQISADRINAIRANEYFYQSYGKGDPFATLVSGKYEPTGAAELVDLNSASLVGVMWGQDDRFALVEDGEGFGYILRVGDQVRNGRVVSIRKSSLTAQVTLYGISSNVVLKLDNLEE